MICLQFMTPFAGNKM